MQAAGRGWAVRRQQRAVDAAAVRIQAEARRRRVARIRAEAQAALQAALAPAKAAPLPPAALGTPWGDHLEAVSRIDLQVNTVRTTRTACGMGTRLKSGTV
jgi:hypothetical protein